MLRTEISKDERLYPGDVIEMHFKVFGPDWVYFRAAELAALIWRLEKKNPDYELIAWDSTTHKDKLILTFRILKSNPVFRLLALRLWRTPVFCFPLSRFLDNAPFARFLRAPDFQSMYNL